MSLNVLYYFDNLLTQVGGDEKQLYFPIPTPYVLCIPSKFSLQTDQGFLYLIFHVAFYHMQLEKADYFNILCENLLAQLQKFIKYTFYFSRYHM